jgi:hypothetical protein
MNKGEPKYLIKFTNAHNDNGTVWYTIDVTLKILRFSSRKKTNIGLFKKDSAICVIYISHAKKPNTKMNYLFFHLVNFLGVRMKLLSKKEKNNYKTTTILSSKRLI